MFHARKLDPVEIQPREHAPMQRLQDLGELVVPHVLPELLHGALEVLEDLLVGLGPLPQDLGVALDQVAVDPVDVEVGVDLAAVDLIAHRDGVLEAP